MVKQSEGKEKLANCFLVGGKIYQKTKINCYSCKRPFQKHLARKWEHKIWLIAILQKSYYHITIYLLVEYYKSNRIGIHYICLHTLESGSWNDGLKQTSSKKHDWRLQFQISCFCGSFLIQMQNQIQNQK